MSVLAVGAWFLAHHIDLADKLHATFSHLYARSPTLCIALFGAVQIVVAICGVLPASIGAIASGMLFGTWPGFCLAAIATLIGALVAFSLSRSVLRRHIQGVVSRYRLMSAMDNMVERQGWRIVCLMRLSPVLPFAITSYALGLTRISSKAYLIGTFASLPPLLGYVVMGHLTALGVSGAASGSISWVRAALLILAGVATVLLIAQLARALATHLKSNVEGS